MGHIPDERVALALDNSQSKEHIENLVQQTAPWVGVFKFGLEQFTRFGPSILDIARSKDRKIFLDLKFHDIPNTVAKAVSAACELGVDLLTIHTSGGLEMMRAAANAARKYHEQRGKAPKIIGITVLTSVDTTILNNQLQVQTNNASQYTRHLASLAIEAGLDGIVCAATDLPDIKPLLPAHFAVITPGIRPQGTSTHDQKRVTTPKDAIDLGATLLVIGRPINQAANPAEAAEQIVDSII